MESVDVVMKVHLKKKQLVQSLVSGITKCTSLSAHGTCIHMQRRLPVRMHKHK